MWGPQSGLRDCVNNPVVNTRLDLPVGSTLDIHARVLERVAKSQFSLGDTFEAIYPLHYSGVDRVMLRYPARFQVDIQGIRS